MVKTKLRPHMGPTPEKLRESQEAANRLLLLDKWTEAPNNPPVTGPATAITPLVLAPTTVVEVSHVPDEPEAQAVEPAAPVRAIEPTSKKPPAPMRGVKPWEGEGAAKPHPYHLVMSEGLFQKVDYVWKRKGYKSMREWVLHTLEHEAGKQLKSLGEA